MCRCLFEFQKPLDMFEILLMGHYYFIIGGLLAIRALRRILKFNLIPWCRNLVERHSYGKAQLVSETVPFHKISTPGN